MKRIIKICTVLAAAAVLGLGMMSCKHGHGGGGGGGGGGDTYTPSSVGGDGGGVQGTYTSGGGPSPTGPSLTLRSTPTADELKVLEEMNKARTDPHWYILNRVEPQRGVRSVKSTACTDAEFDAALDELEAEMNAMSPKASVPFSVGLFKAAQEWVLIQGAGTEWGHQDGGAGIPLRINRLTGCNDFSYGEVIAYGPSTPEDIVVGLLIDDCMNEPGSHYRGHRYCILEMNDKGPWTYAGPAIGPHGLSGTMCCVDFAGGNYHD